MTVARRPVEVALRAVRGRRSVALCYHGVGHSTAEQDPHFLQVAPDAFRAQLELMLGAGFRFVPIGDLVAAANGGPPPPGLAALTFDDGMVDNLTVVLPIVRELGVPATVYVATGMIGAPNPWMEGSRMMTEEELRELAAGGIELGAHTVTHPDLSTLGYEECLEEMVTSRREVERIAGAQVRTFAYPFCSYGEPAVAAARDAGFEAAVTCHDRGGFGPHEVARTMITGKDGLPSFALKLGGAYHPLFNSLAGRAARGGTRAIRKRARSWRERA